MTRQAFNESLAHPAPPADFSPIQKAVWYSTRGDWETAHTLVQSLETDDAAWIHAWLHRKEGDSGNAGYWYTRARRPAATDSLDDELARIADELVIDRSGDV